MADANLKRLKPEVQLTERNIEYAETEAEIEAYKKRIDELEQALMFYADPETYFAISFFSLSDVLNKNTGDEQIAMVPDHPCGEFAEDVSLCGDRWRPGKLARQTLRCGCYVLNNPEIKGV